MVFGRKKIQIRFGYVNPTVVELLSTTSSNGRSKKPAAEYRMPHHYMPCSVFLRFTEFYSTKGCTFGVINLLDR